MMTSKLHSENIFPFTTTNMDCFDFWYSDTWGYNKRSRKRYQILEVINYIKRKQV